VCNQTPLVTLALANGKNKPIPFTERILPPWTIKALIKNATRIAKEKQEKLKNKPDHARKEWNPLL